MIPWDLQATIEDVLARQPAVGLLGPRQTGMITHFLERKNRDRPEWGEDFIRTNLERDIPSLGPRVPATPLHQFSDTW